MQISAIPTKFPIPFANNAGVGYIRAVPQASQIGIQNGAASLTDGFPPLCFLAIAAGGSWPWGEDVNGLLNQITKWNQWQQAGAPVGYDGSFSSSISGYPKGATIASSSTVGGYWLSTADNNTTDPDTGGSGWIFLPPENWGAAKWTDTGTTNAIAITLNPVPAGLSSLGGVSLQVLVANTNTSSVTLNVNGLGATAATNPGGVAIAPGQLLGGSIYTFVYGASYGFTLVSSSRIAQPQPVSISSGTGGAMTANSNYVTAVSFTAPAAGYVYAFGGHNMAAAATSGNLGVTGTLSVNGATLSTDATLLTQWHQGVAVVTSGETVAIQYSAATGSTPPGSAATLRAGGFFVPKVI